MRGLALATLFLGLSLIDQDDGFGGFLLFSLRVGVFSAALGAIMIGV
jgi:hypothetical protein